MDENNTSGQVPSPGEPPQAPPPPAQQYAAQPAAPQKSRKPIVIIAIVVAILLLLACGCGIVAFMVFQDEAVTQEQVDQTFSHLDDALAPTEEIDLLWMEWEMTGSFEESPPVDASVVLLEEARADMALARSSAEELRDSTFKSELVASIEDLDAAIVLFEGFFTEFDVLWAELSEITELAERAEAASSKTEDAVMLLNDEKYSEGGKKAQEAKKELDATAQAFRDVHAKNPSLEADKLAALMDKMSEQTEHLINQADYGKKNSVSAYNKEVKAYNALIGEINDMPDPAWMDDYGLLTGELWVIYDDAYELLSSAEDAAYRADLAAAEGDY